MQTLNNIMNKAEFRTHDGVVSSYLISMPLVIWSLSFSHCVLWTSLVAFCAIHMEGLVYSYYARKL